MSKTKKLKNSNIAGKVAALLKKPKSSRLAELEDLSQKMKEKGLLKKREFDLPMIDTIGKTAYQSESDQATQGVFPDNSACEL